MKRLTLALATLLVLATLGGGVALRRPRRAPAPAAPAPRRADARRARGAGAAAPAPASKIDKGDTAWMLTSSALVLLMTAPGLALFYGGMVRQKNALATLMQSFIIMAVISIQWVLWGYSLAFGPDKGGIIGGLDWIGLRGVGARAVRRLLQDDPAPGVHAVPDDVRDHHAGADHRRLRRAHEVLGLPALHACCGRRSSTTRSRTGCGATAAG